MCMKRTWRIQLCVLSITTVLALQYPMRYQQQRRFVEFTSISRYNSKTFGTIYQHSLQQHRRIFNYVRSTLSDTSQTRHWISSSLLRMASDDDFRMTNADGWLPSNGSTKTPQTTTTIFGASTNDIDDTAMIQQWEELYQNGGGGSSITDDKIGSLM
jgi:hypothetical protein